MSTKAIKCTASFYSHTNMCLKHCRYKKREVQKEKKINDVERVGFVPAGPETLKDYVEQSQSSGSGSGLPLLVSV